MDLTVGNRASRRSFWEIQKWKELYYSALELENGLGVQKSEVMNALENG